jgi:hypothetical protein
LTVLPSCSIDAAVCSSALACSSVRWLRSALPLAPMVPPIEHEEPARRQGRQPGRDVPAGHHRPPGFTISTEACTVFTEQGRDARCG